MDNETINLTDPERLRIRYEGEEVEEASSIDELFEYQSIPLCYKLEEKGTASIAVYVPNISENEIMIYLEPEGREDAAGVVGIKNIAISGNEATAAREEMTANKEADLEAGEPEAQNEEDGAESAPAFELGFVIAGITAAYGLRRRK